MKALKNGYKIDNIDNIYYELVRRLKSKGYTLEDKYDIMMMLGISTGSWLKLELAWTLSIDG